MIALIQAVQEALGNSVSKAVRLIALTRSHLAKVNAKDKQAKLYSWYAPELACISKDKSRHSYEFGVEAGISTTPKETLIVGARAFPGNPYDGHTLNEQVEQASILIQAAGLTREAVYVDLAYRGVDIKYRSTLKLTTEQEKKMLKLRQAIEPIIGHLKANHRTNRCHLKGSEGDGLHAALRAAGYNIRWLLRMIIKKGVGPFLRLFQAAGLTNFTDLLRKLRQILTIKPTNYSSMNWVMR